MDDWNAMVGDAYDRGDTMLVFPSEVAAARWRRALASEPSRRAVRSDRVVSWDVFKERAVPVKRGDRPASSLVRRAFVGRALRENAASRFLSVLVNPRYAAAAGGSAGPIARILPQLPMLLDHRGAMRPELAADLAGLMERYRGFLTEHHLFEPEWELSREVDLSHVPWRPVIFWPDLLEDYTEYRRLLGGQVDTVALPAGAQVAALRYATAHDEIDAVCDEIERALDAGVPAHRILVTAADLETVRPWLATEARRRDIPLRFVAGDVVGAQPGGRFFSRIRDVLESEFSAPAVAALLLDRSVPWSAPEFNRLLVEFGYASHCYTARRWGEAFELADRLLADDRPREDRAVVPVSRGQLSVVRGRWHRFSRQLQALRSARTAAALRRALRAFLDDHLAPAGDPRWTDAGGDVEHVYETALTELARIVRLEERGIEIVDPWPFFLAALDERGYVPRGQTAAVAVYPYRVAAGAPAALHCVIGVSQAATRVRSAPPVGVRQDELRQMGWEARDRSAAFLVAYGGLLPGARLTCADDGPSGAQVPAAELTVPLHPDAPPRGSGWQREEDWWRLDEAAPPERLYQVQREGLTRALATTLVPAGHDARREPLPPRLRAALPPPDHYSPSAVDAYLDCPFSYFIRRMLNVREEEAGFRPDRARVLGSVLHGVLETLLNTPPAARDGVVAEVVRKAFDSDAVRFQLPEAGLHHHVAYTTDLMHLLLANPALEQERPGVTEATVSGTIGGVPVSGRADRVVGLATWDGESGTTDGAPLTVLDYKLNLREQHRPGAVFGGPSQDPAESRTLQLPLYALLLEAATGAAVEHLCYVGLRTIDARYVLGGKRSVSRDAMAEFRSALPGFLQEMDGAIRAGRLVCREEPDCTRCRIRAICRSCFVTRRYGDG